MRTPSIITIDGPAGSGKTTVGELLSIELGYLLFDTGLMYRAVTWKALDASIPISDEQAVTHLAEQMQIDVLPPSKQDGRRSDVFVNAQEVTWEIYSPEVDADVSQVSAYPGVRLALTGKQREIGLRGRVVMIGRDIGTVVLPEADLKIYLDASIEERAKRRYEERIARGEPSSYASILSSMRRRDQIDSNRTIAPLIPAADACVIFTDHLSVEEVFGRVRELVKKRSFCTGDVHV